MKENKSGDSISTWRFHAKQSWPRTQKVMLSSLPGEDWMPEPMEIKTPLVIRGIPHYPRTMVRNIALDGMQDGGEILHLTALHGLHIPDLEEPDWSSVGCGSIDTSLEPDHD